MGLYLKEGEPPPPQTIKESLWSKWSISSGGKCRKSTKE